MHLLCLFFRLNASLSLHPARYFMNRLASCISYLGSPLLLKHLQHLTRRFYVHVWRTQGFHDSAVFFSCALINHNAGKIRRASSPTLNRRVFCTLSRINWRCGCWASPERNYDPCLIEESLERERDLLVFCHHHSGLVTTFLIEHSPL